MRRQLIPHSKRDRWYAMLGLLGVAMAIVFFQLGNPLVFVAAEAISATMLLITAYVFQDTKEDRKATDYSEMINLITGTQSSFDNLKAFLEVERERVLEAQRTLEQLKQEKQKLEPVVSAQRDTVEAILAVHHKRERSAKWKDWILAFWLGVLSSLIAGYLLNLIRFVKD